MYFVYILQSQKDPSQYYVGQTDNISRRLSDHNQGKSIYTNKYKPWMLISYTAFLNQPRANEFEKYLKRGSGHAFMKRHLI